MRLLRLSSAVLPSIASALAVRDNDYWVVEHNEISCYAPNISSIVVNQTATISEDGTFRVTISTKDSNVDSFAGVGEGAVTAHSYCEGLALIYNTGSIREFQYGDWEVTGTASLGKGLKGNIRLGMFREWITDDEKRLKDLISFSGPAQSWSGTVRDSPLDPKFCTGLNPGVGTIAARWIRWGFSFEVEKTDEAGPNAKGTIGEKSNEAVTISTKLTGGAECEVDWNDNRCYADRNGFKACYWY